MKLSLSAPSLSVTALAKPSAEGEVDEPPPSEHALGRPTAKRTLPSERDVPVGLATLVR